MLTSMVNAAPSFLHQMRRLLQLAAAPAWAAPTIVALGFAAAILEGTGLLLFIPLIQRLGASPPQAERWDAIFDDLLAPVPQQLVIPFLVVILSLSIFLKNAINFANTWISKYVEGLVAHRLRCRIFDQTILSCIDYRVDTKRTDIVTTIANHTWSISKALSISLHMLVCAGTFMIFIALMFSISASMTLWSLALLGLSAVAIRAATRKAEATGKAVVKENKEFGLRMWESMSSLQLIRAFAREDHERFRFRHVSDRVRRRLLKLDLLWSIPAPISEMSITIFIAMLIIFADSSGMGLGTLAAFLSLLYRLQGPTRELQQSKVALDGLSGAIDDVGDFLRATNEVFLTNGKRLSSPIRSGVAFNNVSFRYAPGDPWALENVVFEIPAGKKTAIVGASGAGKSTIMALLFRFHDPTVGQIVADGTPLPDFDLASWRSRLALMSQDVHLLNDTIEANIGYGDLEAGAAQIRTAAEVAYADDFIRSLPKGYATEIGDQGMRLSGGQRQRIALARTVLRNPDILMLDEATNALDVESEHAFQTALEKYSKHRTLVVIAHRLSTVQTADQIIVMAKGRVVEIGPPRDLLARPSEFARLYGLQQSPAVPVAVP